MSEKVGITGLPVTEEVAAESGEILLDVLWKAGIPLETACGGQGSCGKCKVLVRGSVSPIDDRELAHLSTAELKTGVRLACRASVQGSVEIVLSSVVRADLANNLQPFKAKNAGAPSAIAAAVDIGTTTIKLEVLALPEGKTVAGSAALNPQRVFGHDVMTRIHAARNPSRAATMTAMIRAFIKGMLGRALAELSAAPKQVSRMVVSGNTVMLHLFFGMAVQGLGKYPYRPESLEAVVGAACRYGFDEFEHMEIVGFPAISAYLGGDLVAGLLATGLRKQSETALLIDMGTNSEIVLAGANGMAATSCAAGPALEGMNIQCGMTAAAGAIEGVKISNGLQPRLKVIAGAPKPLGLCGSGIIECLAELRRLEFIDSQGRMISGNGSHSSKPLTRIKPFQGAPAFYLTDDVVFTQKDVRQMQLAKGAVLSGCKALRESLGISRDEIRSVLIAGEFGRHLKIEHLLRLGFVEPFPHAGWSFIGNSSLQGARMVAIDHALLQEARDIAGEVRAFPLAAFDGYQKLFLDSLGFPCAAEDAAVNMSAEEAEVE